MVINRKTAVFVSSLTITLVVVYLLLNRTVSARIYIDPKTIEKTVGQPVAINIYVSDVNSMYSWEIRLNWNTTVLELANVAEGTFLKSRNETFFTYSFNETRGEVIIDCSLLGDLNGASGDGQLASVQFHVNNAGSCDLRLYDTILLNTFGEAIAHNTTNGHFESTS